MDTITVANKVGLLPEEECSWAEDSISLGDRGVKLSWLYSFVRQVENLIEEEWIQYDYQAKASMYFDHVPEPRTPQIPRYQILNTHFLTSNLVKPLTNRLKSPLYARVPLKQRGKPDVFVSHAWSHPLITNNPFAILEIIKNPLQKNIFDDPYVWMDLVSYNQHQDDFKSIASDMKAVIQSIGHVCLPLIDAVPFSRLWVLWEILCAHVTKSKITIYEPASSVYDIGHVLRVVSEGFHSVSEAPTTKPNDKEDILNAMISTFGSVQDTDEYLHKLLEEGLTNEKDKPWRRAKS